MGSYSALLLSSLYHFGFTARLQDWTSGGELPFRKYKEHMSCQPEATFNLSSCSDSSGCSFEECASLCRASSTCDGFQFGVWDFGGLSTTCHPCTEQEMDSA